MSANTDLIYNVKRKMLAKYPRFGSEIAVANIEFKDNLKYHTAATDGKNIYVDPNYFASLSENDRLFTIAHEIMHIKFMHMFRLKDKSGVKRDPELWNIATDAIINANKSANGPANNTPLIPNILLKIIIAGIKNTICLDNDSIALLLLFPIAWKNIPDGICIPLNIVSIRYILNAIHANCIYFSSPLPNIDINLSGIVWNKINAHVLIITLVPSTIFSVCFTLSNFLAP